ncbi:hypothetical protein [Halorussus litoreus]|uniref:hypothetical protein n=1 Tax=Halorussus litoreus TaxID=1710536 RepID=UPI001300B3E4|nr:hypothetical protein [Halorussus litoreus]
MTASNPDNLAARLDRVTYLLVAVVVLQLIDVLGLGLFGIGIAALVGLFVTLVSLADVEQSGSRR